MSGLMQNNVVPIASAAIASGRSEDAAYRRSASAYRAKLIAGFSMREKYRTISHEASLVFDIYELGRNPGSIIWSLLILLAFSCNTSYCFLRL